MNKAAKNRERVLVRPIEGVNWEVWSITEANQARLMQVCTTFAELHFSSRSVLALPLRQLFATPLWLSTTDAPLMRDMIFLQLERRGLARNDTIFDYRILDSTENKTLVLAIALPASLPANLCLNLQNYEPSARTHILPRDEFTLWRENDRLVVAATRGINLAFFQTLGDETLSGIVLQELQCIKMQLEATGVISGLNGITLWGEFGSREISSLRESMGMRVKNEPRPAPVLPAEWLDLVPDSVRQSQELTRANKRKWSLAAAAAGIACVFVVGLCLHVIWLYLQCRRIQSDLSDHAVLVKQLQATADRWDAMDAAINPESYPVEQLLRCASALPPDGVRFTLFKTSGDKILIQGEAKDAPAAFKFAEDLKKSKELQYYRWKMLQPNMLKDTAEFNIEGGKSGANVD